MKSLRWSLAAADDLEEIARYLQEHHPQFFALTFARIYASVKRLNRFPESGRKGRFAQTRELFLKPLPYLLVYRVSGEVVQILRIVHTSRQRH